MMGLHYVLTDQQTGRKKHPRLPLEDAISPYQQANLYKKHPRRRPKAHQWQALCTLAFTDRYQDIDIRI